MASVNNNTHEVYRLHSSTAHDWEEDKNRKKDIWDDGSMSFFWRAHTITVLFVFSCILVYVTLFEEPMDNSDYNMKRICFVCINLKILYLSAFWRLILCLSIVYELALVYVLFQDKMDGFVPTHFFGWWLKWIMDALVCNGLGIYLGMKTLKYLSMKPYHWRSMWNIPTYRGKMKRFALQFTPHSWTDFDWKPTSSLKRWFAMLGVIAVFLLAELNTFYLKFVLWVPPEHYLNLSRLVFFLFMGAMGMRETFQYLDDP
ncbi:hypothetical protein KUTeg_023497 [Tegillarca granosa]|uniref:Phosphatidylserine synthase n=1 Tax=Tegillarca granosa TaxID=220873 RepID=A0ABQ9E2D0_TEGGR|nr:hypothetical protein KUTeg_023497 [Tegillarca granosa]